MNDVSLNDPDIIDREEAEFRCQNPDCSKRIGLGQRLLMKLAITKSWPDYLNPMKTLSQQGIETKVAIETKCQTCHLVNTKIIVI